MRIGSALIDGRETVVVENGGTLIPAPDVTMRDLIVAGANWRSRLDGSSSVAANALDPDDLEWLPPLIPDKLICVGTNYSDHVAEMEAAGGPTAHSNPWPWAFLKPPTTTLVGHGTTVPLPSYAEKIDWEAELALIIGDASRATGPEPLEALFGYTVMNDVSVRDHIPPPHALGLDAISAKGFDKSAPMGPWVVPADEIADPQSLAIRCRVNGMVKQDSSTSNMIFSVRDIITHFARTLTLAPGDVIATGTPAGVGIARRPPETLAPGDVVEAEVDGIGTLRTTFSAKVPA